MNALRRIVGSGSLAVSVLPHQLTLKALASQNPITDFENSSSIASPRPKDDRSSSYPLPPAIRNCSSRHWREHDSPVAGQLSRCLQAPADTSTSPSKGWADHTSARRSHLVDGHRPEFKRGSRESNGCHDRKTKPHKFPKTP